MEPVPNPRDNLLKSSFYFTYVFLVTTGVITFIEAIRTKDPTIRHIMNLETCISIVAAFFYGQFSDMIQKASSEGLAMPYKDITLIRYTDWAITTPMMLLVLCIVLAYEKKTTVTLRVYALVLLFNVLMLWSGYQGETGAWDKEKACVVGFVFFILLFGYLWLHFLAKGKPTLGAWLAYGVFVTVWALYGVVYMMEEKKKNIGYNALDLIAKALVGILFWMYFAHVVTFA